MAILFHVDKGTLLMCDFDPGFKEPEMVKKRVVVVISPKIKARPNIATVVALSTTAPDKQMPYHAQLNIRPKLPSGFASDGVWVKGDMVYSVGFHRLELIRTGNNNGKRTYYNNVLSPDQMKIVQACVMHGMGLSTLTKYL